MLQGSDIQDLVDCIDTDTIRVYAPRSVIFLCGGPADAAVVEFQSLRHAFLRFAYDEPFKDHRVLLAEELNPFFPNGQYSNILKLEKDIALISDLIILFSESFGSIAELGAFSMMDQIAENLLVIIDDYHYKDNSFISLGPLKHLEENYSEQSVCVLYRNDINIKEIRDVKSLDLSVFKERVNTAIKARLAETKSHSTFDKSNEGHLIKLIVGFIQHYGALTLSEIKFYIDCMGLEIKENRLADYLLCAGFADWISKEKRGIKTYYSATYPKNAISFKLTDHAKIKDKDRWRAVIRDYWKQNDADRFSCINSAIKPV